MSSKNQWEIVNFLKKQRAVTPRQVTRLLGCKTKKAHELLRYLARRGVIKNTGRPQHPEYRLRNNGDQLLKPLKEKPAPAETVSTECRRSAAMWRTLNVYGVMK